MYLYINVHIYIHISLNEDLSIDVQRCTYIHIDIYTYLCKYMCICVIPVSPAVAFKDHSIWEDCNLPKW